MNKKKDNRKAKPPEPKDFLNIKAKDLKNVIIESKGEVPPKKLKNLEHLDQAIKILDSTQPLKKKSKWPSITILAIAIITVSLLILFRIPSTEIELDLSIKNARFILTETTKLTDTVVLSELGVSDLRDIWIPPSRKKPSKTISSSEDIGIDFKISVPERKKPRGTITLSGITLPSETAISISKTRLPNQYQLSLETPKGTAIELKVNVKDVVQVGLSNAPIEEFEYSSPRAIKLKTLSSKTSLDLTLYPESQIEFGSQISARDISFIQKVSILENSNLDLRDASAILFGFLYLMDLKDQTYNLRTGESLGFTKSDGMIRVLKPLNDVIKMEFRGNVRGMTSGWQKNKKSLMPTYLEWVKTNHNVVLFWGPLIFLFSLAMSIYRFLKD